MEYIPELDVVDELRSAQAEYDYYLLLLWEEYLVGPAELAELHAALNSSHNA